MGWVVHTPTSRRHHEWDSANSLHGGYGLTIQKVPPRPKSTVAFLLYSLGYKPVYMTQRRYRKDDSSHTP